MEDFFGLLKSELLYLQTFESVEQFKKELVEYLEWYNEKKIKVKLKGLTPLQFRNQSLKSAWLKCPIIGVHFTLHQGTDVFFIQAANQKPCSQAIYLHATIFPNHRILSQFQTSSEPRLVRYQ